MPTNLRTIHVRLLFFCLFSLLISFESCRKDLRSTINTPSLSETDARATVMTLGNNYCYSCGIQDNMPTGDHTADTTELATVIGLKHVNPYLVPNMKTAYANLHINIVPTATHYYVRFQPNSAQQLSTLDSMADLQGVELFDAPMENDIQSEGDYYQDPGIPAEQVTYQYAAVPTTFQFPTGIAYTTLAQIHIPADDYTSVETEAERLAAIQDSLNNGGGTAAASSSASPNIRNCPPNYHNDPSGNCVPDNCSACTMWSSSDNACIPRCAAGYTCDGNGNCIPPAGPPPPAADAAVPAGNITVSEYYFANGTQNQGLRNVRVILKRWFKVEKIYTDNTGHFTGTKRFKHKVKIVVKFKSTNADIRAVRGARIWQQFIPVAKAIGVYSGNKNAITYNFDRSTAGANMTKDIANRYWASATVQNAINEYRDYATQFGLSTPPTGLLFMLNSWGLADGLSSTPLFRKRGGAMNNDFATVFAGNGGAISPANIPNIDIVIGYHRQNPGSAYSPFSSNFIKESVYHEMNHASQYVKMGSNWYQQFFNAEVGEMGHWVFNSGYSPYGDGKSAFSPIIAVGESFAYFIGQYLAGTHFGSKGDPYTLSQEGGKPGLDLVSLEAFVPTLSADHFKWIPKGLGYDLIDDSPNETIVADKVSGFTVGQLFAAYQSYVTRISDFKAKLFTLYGTSQQVQINNLFASYNY